MKIWKGIILYIGAFLLSPLLYNLLPGTVSPNLILILTVILTFLYDDESEFLGLVLGGIFALFMDISYGLYIGPSAVAILATGLIVLFLKRYTNKENLLNAIVIIIATSWIYYSIYWLVYLLIGTTYSYLYAIKFLPLQLLYNAIVGVILYLILIRRVIKHRKDRYFR